MINLGRNGGRRTVLMFGLSGIIARSRSKVNKKNKKQSNAKYKNPNTCIWPHQKLPSLVNNIIDKININTTENTPIKKINTSNFPVTIWLRINEVKTRLPELNKALLNSSRCFWFSLMSQIENMNYLLHVFMGELLM
jgi:hypothetical protein